MSLPDWLTPADPDLVDAAKIPPRPPFYPPLDLTCPACGVDIFGVAKATELVICIGCRAILIFETELTLMYDSRPEEQTYHWALMPGAAKLRRPTDDEERRALADPRVLSAIRTVAAHHARHGSPHPNIDPPDGGPRDDPWNRR